MSDTTTSNAVATVTVTPAEFALINYDADEIAGVVADVAERLGVTNPIRIEVDETTPLAKMSAALVAATDGEPPTDATVVLRVESGALEDTQRLTNFGSRHASESIGRLLLRARDRLRPDFAETPADLDLSRRENAAWDAYCAGRLDRVGIEVNQQRFRYNVRNRFGFTDAADAEFDRLWSAGDLGWSDVVRTN